MLQCSLNGSRLITARKPGDYTTLEKMFEHREILGQQQRVTRGQNIPHLSYPYTPRLHRSPTAEHYRIVRKLETLDVEVMFREGGEIEPEFFDLV